ncbi:MAG TPA: cupredoxin domain-containing protein [Dehalococcoidia bacterium]|nr:cupredoxin domain-containing protein [Dehalococcoidia bacterium]
MADEGQGRRRRRGRRGGRQDAHSEEAQQQQQDEGVSEVDVSPDDQITTGADIPGVTGETPQTAEPSGKATRRERQHLSPGEAGSPMDFWRSGRARTARAARPTAAGARKGPQGLWAKLTSVYLPPWVPVAGIIVLVFGILGVLFVVRSATGAPRIGEAHWHAPYTFWVCDEKQAPAPTWSGGVHTHGDGIVHIHPGSQGEEGAGARLTRWFEYGGGTLSNDEVRLPGSSTTYRNGDECPDGTIGEVQLFVDGTKMENFSSYIPQDGDIIRIVFGAPEEQIQLDDRTIISEEGVTREIAITIDQPDDADESSTTFTPSSITVDAGEIVKLVVTNADEVSHGLRVVGGDGEPNTGDDFVVIPDGADPNDPGAGEILEPGETGFTVIQFNDALPPVRFIDPTTTAEGTISIEDVGVTPTPGPSEEFDSELEVTMSDGAFTPAELEGDAEDRIRVNLTNEGVLAHNLRIAGPDGEFFTEDDIESDDILPGNSGELFIEELPPGTYEFQDDFNPDTMTGTLTLE